MIDDPIKRNLAIKPAVLVPMHKAEPSPEERISIVQCQKILRAHDIYLVCPKGMNVEIYQTLIPQLKLLEVDPKWMGSVAAYNRLMISPLLFQKMSNYSHILIHEPDALVLKDDLHYWCNQDFDYIGAPWFQSNSEGEISLKATGNYGLSLINVRAANQVFSNNRRWYSFSMIIRDFLRGLRRDKSYLSRAIRGIGPEGKLLKAHTLFTDHCDIFWSYLVPKLESSFNIAPPNEAIFFSWESHPEKCFEICNGRIPFGLHAWSKYNLNYLKPILIEAGVNLEIKINAPENPP